MGEPTNVPALDLYGLDSLVAEENSPGKTKGLAMRFGWLIAAVAALWAMPAQAVTIVLDFEGDAIGGAPDTPGGVTFLFNPMVESGGPTKNYLRLSEVFVGKLLTTVLSTSNFVFTKPNGDSASGDTQLVSFDIRANTDGFIQFDGGQLTPLAGGSWLHFDHFAIDGARFRSTGGVSLDNIVINQTFASVPEPTTWSLMILGIGAIGASLRRRVLRHQM